MNTGDANNSTTSPPFPPKPTTVPNIVAPILTLPPSDYRVDRYFLSETLSDSVGESEKICWRDKALPKEIYFRDLEDSKVHYLVIGCNKNSSDKTVASEFHLVSKDLKNIARTHHPDKTSDTAMHSIFEKAKDTYKKQKQAFGVLGTLDTYEGTPYPDCVNYDRLGEDLRKKFCAEFAKTHPGNFFLIEPKR